MKTLLALMVCGGTALAQLPTKLPPKDRKLTFAERLELEKLVKAIGLPPTKEQITAALRSKMRDPDSLVLESIGEITVGKNADLRYWSVPVTYRAANGAGGMNRKDAKLMFYGRSYVALDDTGY